MPMEQGWVQSALGVGTNPMARPLDATESVAGGVSY